MATYQEHLQKWFGGDPAAYAKEIKRKRRLGLKFDDPGAVAAFERDYPGYFKSNSSLGTRPVARRSATASPAYAGHIKYFGSPEAYAAAILAKEKAGQQLTDPAGAAAFRAAHPQYFRQAMRQVAPPQITPREWSPEVRELMELVRRRVEQAPITAEQIMTSPEWQAQQRVLNLARDEAMAALRRGLAARGMLRSTPAVQALAGEEARFEAARAQALPQLLAAAQARQQQALQNYFRLLQQAAGMEEAAWGRGLQEFRALAPYTYETVAQQIGQEQFERTFPLREAAVTGMYRGELTPQARTAIAALTGYDPVTGKATWEREYETKKLAQAAARASRQRGTAKTPTERLTLTERLNRAKGAAFDAVKAALDKGTSLDTILRNIDAQQGRLIAAGVDPEEVKMYAEDLAYSMTPPDVNPLSERPWWQKAIDIIIPGPQYR